MKSYMQQQMEQKYRLWVVYLGLLAIGANIAGVLFGYIPFLVGLFAFFAILWVVGAYSSKEVKDGLGENDTKVRAPAEGKA